MSSRLVALVPAAGSGERYGRPKMFEKVLGRTIMEWTLERLEEAGAQEIAVALPAELMEGEERLPLAWPGVRWAAGGGSRQESVAACLEQVPGEGEDLLLVHDGARPAVSRRDLAATIAAAREADGAVLGRPVVDTLKRVERGHVLETVDRAPLFRAETPQVFRRELFERALERAREEAFTGTDEASLVERLGGVRIRAVTARDPNPKLTVPADLVLIRTLLAGVAAEARP